MALSDRLYDRQFVPQQGSGIFQRTTPGNEGEAQGFGFDQQQPMSGPTESQPVPGYNAIGVRKNERGEDEYGVMTRTMGFKPVRGNPGTMSFKMDAAEVARMDLMEQERQVAVPLAERKFAAEREDKRREYTQAPISLPDNAPDWVKNPNTPRAEQFKWLQEDAKEKGRVNREGMKIDARLQQTQNSVVSGANAAARTAYNSDIKPMHNVLSEATTYHGLRATGETAGAARLAAGILDRSVREGSRMLKDQLEITLGTGFTGGSLDERMANFLSQWGKGGPTSEHLQTLDKLMNSVSRSAVNNIATRTKFHAGQIRAIPGASVYRAIGQPRIYAVANRHLVVTPDGETREFETEAKAKNAVRKWITEFGK